MLCRQIPGIHTRTTDSAKNNMSFELITANQHPNMDYRIANTNYGL